MNKLIRVILNSVFRLDKKLLNQLQDLITEGKDILNIE